MNRRQGFQQKIPDEIILRAQEGDMNAVESIYHYYANAAFTLALRICGGRALAEDVLQESFLKIIKSISSFKNNGSFAGSVRRIVVNEAINKLRNNSKLHFVGEESQLLDVSGDFLESHWIDSCLDINKSLLELTDTARCVLVMHEIEGFSHKEIGDFFNKSESFSKATLSRAYSKLKQLSARTHRVLKHASK